MRLKAHTLAAGTIGLSAGFVVTLAAVVMPAQMANSRLKEATEVGRLQAAFVARHEREAAQLARVRAFEGQRARRDQLFREARSAVEKTLVGTNLVRFDKLRIAEAAEGSYVCGEVGVKRAKAAAFIHRSFIYSANGELAIRPPKANVTIGEDAAGKWQDFEARAHC
jgi:hypothetical protein